jgi:hypothetical protein
VSISAVTRHPRALRLAVSAAAALATLPGASAAAAQADLSLSVLPAAPLGPFLPGVAADYTTSAVATVTTPTPNATLTIVDASGVGVPGELYNQTGAVSLDAPLQASGSSSAPGATGNPFGPIGPTQLTLVTYSPPVTGDPVTIDLMQPIGASEALRSGTYSKTVTLTLTEGP